MMGITFLLEDALADLIEDYSDTTVLEGVPIFKTFSGQEKEQPRINVVCTYASYEQIGCTTTDNIELKAEIAIASNNADTLRADHAEACGCIEILLRQPDLASLISEFGSVIVDPNSIEVKEIENLTDGTSEVQTVYRFTLKAAHDADKEFESTSSGD